MDMVWLCCLFALLSMAHGGNVTYDGRSLIINGEHKILFSGEIHYPRSTPQVIYCFFHYYSHQIKAQQIFEIWKVFLMFSIYSPFFWLYILKTYDSNNGIGDGIEVFLFFLCVWKYTYLEIVAKMAKYSFRRHFPAKYLLPKTI